MELPSLLREVLVRMGVHLLTLQCTEHVIRLCLQIVLPREPINTLEDLRSLEQREGKKTIGYFLAALRQRADIAPEFDEQLTTFLAARNSFAHDLSSVPGWDMRTEEGCRKCIELLEQWEDQATEVQNVFAGLLRIWELQSGKPTQLPGAEALFATIERDFVPKVPQLFTVKDA
jgi:hypothetical protein